MELDLGIKDRKWLARNYDHTIKTSIGEYYFKWDRDGYDAIYGIWEKPELAKNLYGSNPHSGKQNFHGRECFKDFMYFLNYLKNKKII